MQYLEAAKKLIQRKMLKHAPETKSNHLKILLLWHLIEIKLSIA